MFLSQSKWNKEWHTKVTKKECLVFLPCMKYLSIRKGLLKTECNPYVEK